MGELICDTFIPGQTKTKGSMRARPNLTMEESVRGSKAWRRLMTRGITMDRQARGLTVPCAGPVAVRATFFVDGPSGMSEVDKVTGDAAPIHKGSGDVDKLARNLFDAMHDTRTKATRAATREDVTSALREAWAIVEDVQVVHCELDKVFRLDPHPWGVHVSAWAMSAYEIYAQRQRAYAATGFLGYAL